MRPGKADGCSVGEELPLPVPAVVHVSTGAVVPVGEVVYTRAAPGDVQSLVDVAHATCRGQSAMSD